MRNARMTSERESEGNGLLLNQEQGEGGEDVGSDVDILAVVGELVEHIGLLDCVRCELFWIADVLPQRPEALHSGLEFAGHHGREIDRKGPA